jgi:signal transduction histidine kinase
MSTFQMVQEIFYELYGQLGTPAILFDGKGEFIRVNQAFLDLAKAKQSDLKNHFIFSFFQDISEEISRKWGIKFFPERQITNITDLENNITPVLFFYKKFLKEDNTYEGGLGFVTDISDLDKANRTIKELTLENETLKAELTLDTGDTDIKEKKRLEQEVRETKEFLENIIESCGDGILIVDNNGEIIHTNGSLSRILNKNRQAIKGIKLYELGPLYEGTYTSTTGEVIVITHHYRQDQAGMLAKFFDLNPGEKLENWEFYLFNNKNELVPVEFTISIQKTSEGILQGAVCSARDITERKKSEKALREAYEFRSRFFSNITHEFRTPLTLSIGPMESILRGEFGTLGPALKDQVSLALRNCRQLLKLVNQLLDFSRLESGERSLHYENRVINEFVRTVIDSFSQMSSTKDIKLNFSPGTMETATIDPGKMEKVLFNILGNAFKFTPKGGSITVSLEQVQAGLTQPDPDEIAVTCKTVTEVIGVEGHRLMRIAIQDNGIGIRQENITKIFDRFKQTGEGFALEQGGTGIGLAHARELVELMGGCITVKSVYGKGSIFSVYIPDAASEAGQRTGEEQLYLQPEIELSREIGTVTYFLCCNWFL